MTYNELIEDALFDPAELSRECIEGAPGVNGGAGADDTAEAPPGMDAC